MNQLVLFGAYGFGNLGDRLLADYYRSLLHAAFPDRPHRIISADPMESAFPEETLHHRREMLSLLYGISPGDLWIAGGGSLLQNRTSRRSLLYYISILELASLRGAQVVMLGQGYGPICGKMWQFFVRHALSNVQLIECRDFLTYQRVMKMSLKKTELRRGIDPIWGIEPPRMIHAGNYLLLIVKSADRNRIPRVLEVLSRTGCGEQLRVVALAGRDDRVLHEICGKNYAGLIPDLKNFWSLAGGARGLLSSRLHGIILGALAGLPAIGLGDDPKISGVCEELGFVVNPLSRPQDYENLPGMVDKLHFGKDVEDSVQIFKDLARENKKETERRLHELGDST
ncbi:MAG TPA: polysaccharide pyruvyl transferase family protein [Bacillota bacterium]|nr:polysaccharide pyruvyl transferase family protein [Bacillota bacterium]